MKHASTLTTKKYLSYVRRGALLLALGAAGPGAWGQSFGTRNDYATGGGPSDVALGDVNGDGRLDVVTANSSTASVLLGLASGGVGPKTDYPTGSNSSCVVLGDVNNDGRLDIATSNANAGTVSVLLGLAAGGFGPKTDYGVGSIPRSMALGDVTGDGRLDIVVVGSDYAGTVLVLPGRAAGGFSLPSSNNIYSVGGYPYGVALGDLNSDGRLDIVTTGILSGTASVLPGLAGGGFGTRADYATGTNPVDVALGDVNGDGRLDIVSSLSYGGNASVLLGQAAGGFGPIPANYLTALTPRSVALGDVTGDGRLDIVTTCTYSGSTFNSNVVSVLPNLAGGGFGPYVNYPVGNGTQGVALGDMNGDGRLDIVATNYDANTVSVLLNTGTYTPLATAHPTTADIILAPNPAHDVFTVQLPAGLAPTQAELLNTLGQVVRRPAVSSGSFTVETSGLAPGLYTLRLQAGGTALARRVVVE